MKRKVSENFELAPDASGQVLIFTAYLWLMRHRQSQECWGRRLASYTVNNSPSLSTLYTGIFGKMGISGIV